MATYDTEATYDTDDAQAAIGHMAVGEARTFPVLAGGSPADLRRRLCVLAHRAWGKGSYRSALLEGGVRLTRAPPGGANSPPIPAPIPAPPPTTGARFLTREQAAERLAPYFPGGITAAQLRGFAARKTGPRYYKNGSAAIYRPGDLDAWVLARVRPAGTPYAA